MTKQTLKMAFGLLIFGVGIGTLAGSAPNAINKELLGGFVAISLGAVWITSALEKLVFEPLQKIAAK